MTHPLADLTFYQAEELIIEQVDTPSITNDYTRIYIKQRGSPEPLLKIVLFTPWSRETARHIPLKITKTRYVHTPPEHEEAV